MVIIITNENTEGQKDRWTDIKTKNKWRDRQTDGQTNGRTDRQAYRQTNNRQLDWWTNIKQQTGGRTGKESLQDIVKDRGKYKRLTF